MRVGGGGLMLTSGGPTWEGPGSSLVESRPTHIDAVGQLV